MQLAEYQQLLQQSQSFRDLELAEQQLILNADEHDREYYTTIYQDENRLLADSDLQYQNEVKVIHLEYKFSFQKEQSQKIQSAENTSRATDNSQADQLLNQLNL